MSSGYVKSDFELQNYRLWQDIYTLLISAFLTHRGT